MKHLHHGFILTQGACDAEMVCKRYMQRHVWYFVVQCMMIQTNLLCHTVTITFPTPVSGHVKRLCKLFCNYITPWSVCPRCYVCITQPPRHEALFLWFFLHHFSGPQTSIEFSAAMPFTSSSSTRSSPVSTLVGRRRLCHQAVLPGWRFFFSFSLMDNTYE